MCNNDTSMSTSTSVHKPVKSERAWPDQNTHKHTTQGLKKHGGVDTHTTMGSKMGM